MNKNQKSFLTELMTLFDKYNIDEMYINDTGGITFISNGQELSVQKYVQGEYSHIVTTTDSFEPEETTNGYD